MLTKEEIDHRIKTQLSYEFNCDPDDFSGEEILITSAVLHDRRRVFSEELPLLQMATFGNNAVISADERLHPWLREWINGKKGFWLFGHQNYFELEKELGKYGCRMASPHHMFAPKPEYLDIETDLKIRWLEQEDIMDYYGREEFPNALCDRFHPERPDMLAVIALDGERIMGMAGCSADSPEMWQIGIDVLPEYRRRGIARQLLEILLVTCRKTKTPETYLEVRVSNAAAIELYRSLGFETDGLRKSYYQDGEDALTMARHEE